MAQSKITNIWVYADWAELNGCRPLGLLTSQLIRGKEIFAFDYEKEWLKHEKVLFLDPNLGMYQGKQYLPEDKMNFGLFLDSSPDRWGRLLMRRREAILAKRVNRAERVLSESDYLLGVFDGSRMGGVRFKVDPDGNFMNDKDRMATPPWTSLRDLEFASLQLERGDVINDPHYDAWLMLLVNPGSSLGGARPKSSVLDEKGNLWIAKFPSLLDDKNSGAWEFVLNRLAASCKIRVPEAKLLQLSGKQHTFLSKRFDRMPDHRRIHYASSMTLLGYNDGTDNHDGVSYLEIASFIIQNGSMVTEDLDQLWRRIVFNIITSNTDDHLRNHGFLLSDSGWRLSPAFDMNPDKYGNGLNLNINETSNDLNLELAMEVAKYFRIKQPVAEQIVKEMIQVVKNWRSIAKRAGINQTEIDSMKNAFKV